MANVKSRTAQEEWKELKKDGEYNVALDKLMEMVGLEEVKREFLRLFNAVFLGNPGTGKTTIARLYSEFLQSLEIYGTLPQWHFLETSGALLANQGVPGCEKLLGKIPAGHGGVLFVDEAYQLVSDKSSQGRSALDHLLVEMENLRGRVVFVFAGYKKSMDAFFAYNEGIRERVPLVFDFKDYDEQQLLQILRSKVKAKYSIMTFEVIDDHPGDFLLQLVARRLSRTRNTPGFGNARAVENALFQIDRRFSERLERERQAHARGEYAHFPSYFHMLEEDVLGPRTTNGLKNNKAWIELEAMIGLEQVKKSISSLIKLIQTNRTRELSDLAPLECNLNRVFLGGPGTGKTTVAKLYGQILVDLGMLSNGEVVVKDPSDFISGHVGGSQVQAKQILEATKGKVLVIDEAYMLNPNTENNGGTGHKDPFKSDVIGTIVAEVQGKAGDDRCILLLGYKDKMEAMFRDCNEGFQRRFRLQDAFEFEDYTAEQMREIWRSKCKQLQIECGTGVEDVAMEIVERQRNKMNFGNAGEIDNLLEGAKSRCIERVHGTSSHFGGIVKLDKSDIDPDFDRAMNAGRDIEALFKGVVGCDEIKEKIKGYSKMFKTAQEVGENLQERIPMTFIFKGPPGTGKTSTARNIGSVFYSLGLLGGRGVVEVSANELVGQYIGQTTPRVRKQMEAALGKVLFIDEAYRLAGSSFGAEALDELLTRLTDKKFERKLVVILAGYSEKMDELMELNVGLRGRFEEELDFPALRVEDSLKLMEMQLIQKCFVSLRWSSWKEIFTVAMHYLVSTHQWANARDIKTLSRKIQNAAMLAHTGGPLITIRLHTILREMKRMMLRSQVASFERVARRRHLLPGQANADANHALSTKTSTKTKSTTAKTANPAPIKSAPSHTQTLKRKPGFFDSEERESKRQKREDVPRDKGTSDRDWKELQAKKAEEKKRQEELRRQKKFKELQEQQRKNAKAQAKLKKMGRCVQGYEWIKVDRGWRCAGGYHFASDRDLDEW
ncbi:hypothetical protein SLS62_007416 [Diatrype stigma]|uniref:AAA+ ATPase domain-containing protein n=1 Tax=Diatrype stigma TaxID=117547 RepID=A0AAN9UMV3_9PEZI